MKENDNSNTVNRNSFFEEQLSPKLNVQAITRKLLDSSFHLLILLIKCSSNNQKTT